VHAGVAPPPPGVKRQKNEKIRVIPDPHGDALKAKLKGATLQSLYAAYAHAHIDSFISTLAGA